MSTSLSPLDGPKLAGLEAVFFAEARQLGPLPDRDGLVLLGDLVLPPNVFWGLLPGRIYSQALDVEAASGPHGTSYAHELSGFFAGDAAQAALHFANLQGRRYVVLYRDFQGLVRLVGDPRAGLQFSYKLKTGSKPGEAKGYTWTFKGVTPTPALFYEGVFVASNGGNQPPPVGGPVSLYDAAGNVMATAFPGQKMILTSSFEATISVVPA